jgi:hypothetical protein
MLPAGVMDDLEHTSNSSKTSAGSNLGEHYQILYIQSSAPDDGGKYRPKHVQPAWNNKLIYTVHLFGYFYSCVRNDYQNPIGVSS